MPLNTRQPKLTWFLSDYQEEILRWSNYNWGKPPKYDSFTASVGIGEEAGEVLRAVLKRKQMIRGTYEEWTAELRKELADVLIKVIEVAALEDMNIEVLLQERWDEIRQRDFKANALGHGIEKG